MTTTNRLSSWMPAFVIGLAAWLALQGCHGNQRHQVIAVTGTNIGVEVSQNPATQSPQAKLGYQRAEFAIVPTNRKLDDKDAPQGHGATDVPDVVMELKYSGLFDFGEMSGIYQRLAVGSTAVKQPGASVMFVRNAKGEVTENGVAAIAAAVSEYQPDDNSKCIEVWIKADKSNNLKKLRAWLKDKQLPEEVTLFVDGKRYGEARAAAVKDTALGIACN